MLNLKVLALAIFLAVLTTGDGLKCYACNGGGDSACADPIKADILEMHNQVKMCDEGHVCIKYKSQHVQRSCSPATVEGKDMCTYAKYADCSTCTTDLCNSSNKIATSSLALSGVILIIAIYMTQ